MTALDEVAELLKSAETSSAYRTVVSRSYYVSYRTLIQTTAPLGFDPDARDDHAGGHRGVHARLFDFLRRSDKAVLSRIGRNRVRTLYALRIKADYQFKLPVRAREATEALSIAQDIADWISDST